MIHQKPRRINDLDEFSAINPLIRALNFTTVAPGNEAYEYLLYSDKLERRNTGRLADKWLKRYQHLEDGGWWCSGLDPFDDWREMNWGCFKPESPKEDFIKGKLIKYEHPPKEDTRAFFLKNTRNLALEAVRRYNDEKAWLVMLLKAYRSVRPDDTEDYLVENVPLPMDMIWEQFWHWVLATPKVPVIICEGAKKAAALLSAGYVAVAIPGVFQGFRTPLDENGNRQLKKRHLIPEIDILAQNGRQIYICFDQDTKQKTVNLVNSAIATFSQLIEEKGSPVKVISWDAKLGKGVDDLIAGHGVEAFDEAYERALSPYHYERKASQALTYSVAQIVNRRYLGDIEIPELEKLVCLKAPKGTGKTETISSLVADAIHQGQAILILTHRVQLGEALCNRFGVPYVTQLRAEGKHFGYGLCVDSLHGKSQARFNAEGWDDALVIIDECEQVFWHLLSASTEVGKNRVNILRQFKQLIKNTIQGNGRVILSDADLSDVSIDYIRGLAEVDVNPWILENTYKPADGGCTVYSYSDKNPARIVQGIERAIAKGQRLLVLCSGQKITSKWGTQILEARLKQRFPNAKILRVDSETISDPSHEAYGTILHANETFRQYDIVIASPSIETGVSIDIKGHFHSVWGIAQGNLAETSVRQQLARLRENVPRFVWAASYGGKLIGNGATNASALLASQDRAYKAHIALLQKQDLDLTNIEATPDQTSLRTWAKFAARINAGKIKYRESILQGLEDEGHTIIEMEEDGDSEHSQEIADELSELRDCCHLEEAEAEAATDLITQSEYEKLASKKAKTKEERLKERKFGRYLKYGVEITQPLILKDDDGWHPQIQLHYYSTVGRKYLADRDKKKAQNLVEKGDNGLFMPDFNRSQLGGKVALLESTGILKLLSPDREYRKTDEDLIKLAEFVKFHKRAFKEILKVTISDKDTEIAIVQLLLRLLGLKLTYLRREGSREDRVRVYGFKPAEDGRDAIYQAWLERDSVSSHSNSNTTQLDQDVA